MNYAYEIENKKHLRGAFSLIELMIAIAIIGVLVTVIGPNLMNFLNKSKISAAKSTLRTFEQAITMYQVDVGQYPSVLKDLVKQPTDEIVAKKWQGPYIKRKDIPLDPWGNKYQYQPTPDAQNPYELYTRGSKGKAAQKTDFLSVWDEE